MQLRFLMNLCLGILSRSATGWNLILKDAPEQWNRSRGLRIDPITITLASIASVNKTILYQTTSDSWQNHAIRHDCFLVRLEIIRFHVFTKKPVCIRLQRRP